MSFDFRGLKYAAPRTLEIEVPELVDIWGGEGTPLWKIRSLSGDEIGFANQQASEETQRRLKGLTEAIATGAGIGKAIEELAGEPGKVSPEGLKRTYFLVFGSVDPKIDFDAATKLRRACYPVFLRLTDQIIILSGRGYDLGKSKPSGEIPKSSVQ
ncbi:MAG: hypothetical protein AB1457_16295 [Chloroflexota bacterium]